jgi:hypothetical protein
MVNTLHAAEWILVTIDAIRWDEKAGLRLDAVGSQVIDVLEDRRQ